LTLRSLWSLLKGYVIIRVTGRAVEDFINEAYTSGVELWNLQRIDERSILGHIYLQDLPEIGKMLKRTDCTGRIERKIGLPFLIMKLSRRKGFAIGAILFSVILYLLSSFVWFVNVTGCDKMSPDTILEFIAKQGVKAGVLRREVDSTSLGRAILAEFPGLAWVGVHIKGTTVNIEVAEKTLPQARSGITHLVAAEDALVTNMIVLAGEPLVSEGDTVAKGQMLVTGIIISPYGYEDTDRDKRHVINAKGVVIGRVWRTYQGVLELVQEFETETGRVEKAGRLSFGPYELRIGPESAPFQTYTEDQSVWEVPFLGGTKPLIGLTATTYRETEKSVEIADEEEALEDLKEEAFAHVKAKIPGGAKILDEREELKYSEERKWVYTLTIETLEDIAQERSEDREGEH
jgi:similar to stage IV sporulation protein